MSREMKDSGVEWIGEIPLQWKVTSLTRLFFIEAGGDAKRECYSDSRDELHPYPVYTNTNIEDKVYAYTSKPLFPENSITVSGRGAIGKAFYRDTPFDAIIRLIVLMPKFDLDMRYFTYFISEVIQFTTGSSAINQLSTIQIAPYKVALPSLSEQKVIASFLDEKTSEIDKLIEQTKQSIEELKAYKQSLITETVTRGINPDVPMIDSGIEWIEKIPQDWRVIKLKYLVSLRNEKGKFNKGDEYIGLEHVGSYLGDINGRYILQESSLEQAFYNNDILYSKLRPYLAKAFIADFNGSCSGEFLVFNNFKGNEKFLLYWLISTIFTEKVYSMVYGAKMPRSSWSDIKELSITYPTIEEQNEIVSYLDDRTQQINHLITKKQQMLKELESYKQSLIYEYVTGKKEVK